MEKFRLSVKSFIVKNNRLLLIKRNSNNTVLGDTWEIPGGRLEIGENPYVGLLRETKEETGLDIQILKPLNIRHFKRADDQTITMIIFLCETNSENIILSEEHSSYIWQPLESCHEMINDFYLQELNIFMNNECFPKPKLNF